MYQEDYRKALVKACEMFVEFDCCPPENWSECSGAIMIMNTPKKCQNCWYGYLIYEAIGKNCSSCNHQYNASAWRECPGCGWEEKEPGIKSQAFNHWEPKEIKFK